MTAMRTVPFIDYAGNMISMSDVSVLRNVCQEESVRCAHSVPNELVVLKKIKQVKEHKVMEWREKQRIIDECEGGVTAVWGTEEPRGGRGRGGGGRQAGAKSTEVRSIAIWMDL